MASTGSTSVTQPFAAARPTVVAVVSTRPFVAASVGVPDHVAQPAATDASPSTTPATTAVCRVLIGTPATWA